MFNEATKMIENRLKDNWSDTPISFDNVNFNPVKGTPFVRLTILWADTVMTSVTGRAKAEGIIDVSIFVPLNNGTQEVNQMANDIAEIYNLYNRHALQCLVARTQRIGEGDEWYQLKVLVPFWYDACIALPSGYGGLCGYGN